MEKFHNRLHKLLVYTYISFTACRTMNPVYAAPSPITLSILIYLVFIEVPINFSCLCVSLFLLVPLDLRCWPELGGWLVRIESQWHTTKRGIELGMRMGFVCLSVSCWILASLVSDSRSADFYFKFQNCFWSLSTNKLFSTLCCVPLIGTELKLYIL